MLMRNGPGKNNSSNKDALHGMVSTRRMCRSDLYACKEG